MHIGAQDRVASQSRVAWTRKTPLGGCTRHGVTSAPAERHLLSPRHAHLKRDAPNARQATVGVKDFGRGVRLPRVQHAPSDDRTNPEPARPNLNLWGGRSVFAIRYQSDIGPIAVRSGRLSSGVSQRTGYHKDKHTQKQRPNTTRRPTSDILSIDRRHRTVAPGRTRTTS